MHNNYYSGAQECQVLFVESVFGKKQFGSISFKKNLLIINSYDDCWSFLENLFIEGFPRAN